MYRKENTYYMCSSMLSSHRKCHYFHRREGIESIVFVSELMHKMYYFSQLSSRTLCKVQSQFCPLLFGIMSQESWKSAIACYCVLLIINDWVPLNMFIIFSTSALDFKLINSIFFNTLKLLFQHNRRRIRSYSRCYFITYLYFQAITDAVIWGLNNDIQWWI